MYAAYRAAIVYFVIFGLFLLGSGLSLFLNKIGYCADDISLYYLGNGTRSAKSVSGLMETAVPHLGAIGFFVMVAAHFMLFASKKAKLHAVKIATILFAASMLDILCGFFILQHDSVWIWIKLASFTVFMVAGVYLLLMVLFYALWHAPSQ